MTAVSTIGHSTHDWPKFETLLAAADIGAVADVRSFPSSRLPHFGRATLTGRLNALGIADVYLGLELGGRRRNGSAADYETMAKRPLFLEGLSKIEAIASHARPALMCSEHEPLACHRCLLVGRRLVERGAEVAHILRDGRIEPNAATEERLLKLTRQTEQDSIRVARQSPCPSLPHPKPTAKAGQRRVGHPDGRPLRTRPTQQTLFDPGRKL